ncbi:ADP-ribosylglycohydrolase family protein [Streptomyces sp. NPDC004959]|uniref:ADP-ribosylglycohydrolase family protein n=1 Tax=Streptomyces sp. NPDC004959 TaxID=3154673 RepID=UPI0033B798B1
MGSATPGRAGHADATPPGARQPPGAETAPGTRARPGADPAPSDPPPGPQPVWGRPEQQDYRARIRGALLGAALGDALGAPLDVAGGEAFWANGPGDLLAVPGGGRAGTVTAHTQLALFTTEGLIRAQVRRDTGAWHPPTDLHAAYRRWYATQHEWGPDERRTADGWLAREEWLYARRAPERDCLTALGDAGAGTLDRPRNPRALSLAPATRSTPLGLLSGWDPVLVLQLALECAVQTHGHPASTLTAGAHALLVHALTRGADAEDAVRAALPLLARHPGHEPVTEALTAALDAARAGAPDRVRAAALYGDGSPARGLALAVWAAAVAPDIRTGLLLAVGHGPHSAARGALCGALLGAAHGDTALPPDWLPALEGRGSLLALAEDFALEMTQGPALHGPDRAVLAWLERYPREL